MANFSALARAAALALLLAPVVTFAQNVGIGTTTPTSSLTVKGSLAAAYNSQAASYTLTATDYFVAYSGTAAATFTLPAAQAGTASLQGRVYKLKNNSGQPLAITAAGSENINGTSLTNIVVLAAGNVAELISTGATSGTTWELVSSGPLTYIADAIRSALTSTGCANCAAYDAAAVNTWVPVAAADYTALQSLSGAAVYGTPSLASNVSGNFNLVITYTQNVTNQGQVPANAYPYALAMRTGSTAPTTLAGIKLRLSTTSATAGYADWPAAGTAVPSSGAAPVANTLYYYVLKRPTAAPTAAAYLATYNPVVRQLSYYSGVGGTSYYSLSDSATPTSADSGYAPAFQILATPARQW